MSWVSADCRALAEELLAELPLRWRHVQAVGQLADLWVDHGRVPAFVAEAAWVHDIGYADKLRRTGMHSIDGAAHLEAHGVDPRVVALVAHHTGAWAEAEERGLANRLLGFGHPDEEDLDALNLADLLSGPDGAQISVVARVNEILQRYEPQHPVHRAVSRSKPRLLASANRAAKRLG